MIFLFAPLSGWMKFTLFISGKADLSLNLPKFTLNVQTYAQRIVHKFFVLGLTQKRYVSDTG